uniref:ZP domain-containing protein n=1 Tax=Rhabditophanes sp. KR3021 TaxID=114890 RepID=A0AC35U7C4_9BILA
MATFYGPGNVKAGYGSIAPGELIFDANFECGNLGRVDIINKCEYDLFIRPDTCNANYRVWFYFKVWNAAENQSVLLNICNFSKKRTMFEKGDAAPVYKKPNSTEWHRIKRSNVFYSVSNLHGQKPILSITFNFKCGGIYEFAYCIPYGYSHLQKYIHKLETQHSAFLRRDIIAQSVMKKNIDLLTISNHIHSIPKKQKVIFITARVHPGETPASHVLHGLLDFLVSDDYKAFELRDNYTFKIIPMLNPDGVYIGNYRCNIVGNDLNRQYLEPSSWAHPSIMSVKNLLIQYENNSDIELIFCIDIHAHSQQTNGFLIGNLLSKNPQHCETQLILPYLMAENAEDYSLSRTQFNVDSDKAGTSHPNSFENGYQLLDPKGDRYAQRLSNFQTLQNLNIVDPNGHPNSNNYNLMQFIKENRYPSNMKSPYTQLSTDNSIPLFGYNKECPLVCPPCQATNDNIYSRDRNKRQTFWSELTVPIAECYAKTDSLLNPPSDKVSFVVIASYHKQFVTKMDKAYHISCSFPDLHKTVTAGFDVIPNEAENVRITVEPPKCSYILKNIDGSVLTHAMVGEPAIHEWSCNTEAAPSRFNMLVRNCYADNENGKQELVVDEDGCTVDANVLPQIIYSSDKLSATVVASVFKFPDRQYLGFKCSISICYNDHNDCALIIPPTCDRQRSKRSTDNLSINNFTLDEMKLNSQTLTIVGYPSGVNNQNISQALPQTSIRLPSFNLCLSLINFSLLIAFSSFIFTGIITVIITIKFIKYYYKDY